jgi:hypothetical protein
MQEDFVKLISMEFEGGLVLVHSIKSHILIGVLAGLSGWIHVGGKLLEFGTSFSSSFFRYHASHGLEFSEAQ